MKWSQWKNCTTHERNQSTDQNETSELETQHSSKTSSTDTFQKIDKGNEDSDLQNVIASDENVNSQQREIINEKDHLINQNMNNLEHESQQSSKTNNKESLQPTDIVEGTNEDN